MMTIFHGMAMALADSVPGVSGGTIAFILGFYEKLLNTLHNVLDPRKRKEALCYLARFFLGWAVGMGASVLLLSHVFEQNIYFLSSVFLGLTFGAIPFILYEEREVLQRKWWNLVFTVLGAGLVAVLTALRGTSAGLGTIHFQSLSFPQHVYLAGCGVFAICAMLLPGISGSTLLLILGIYVPAVNAVKELLHLHLEYLPGVLALGAGVLLGIVFAVKWIRRALKTYRCQMMYGILGLLLGSLYAICMGPTTLDIPQPCVTMENFHLTGFLCGMLILVGLKWLQSFTAAPPKPAKEEKNPKACE